MRSRPRSTTSSPSVWSSDRPYRNIEDIAKIAPRRPGEQWESKPSWPIRKEYHACAVWSWRRAITPIPGISLPIPRALNSARSKVSSNSGGDSQGLAVPWARRLWVDCERLRSDVTKTGSSLAEVALAAGLPHERIAATESAARFGGGHGLHIGWAMTSGRLVSRMLGRVPPNPRNFHDHA